MLSPFCHPIQIHDHDIDTLGHVNNVVYLRWVQEVAAAHWAILTGEEEKKQLAWVVLRHEIDYHAPALPGDDIVGTTRVGTCKGPRFERFVFIRNAQTGKLLAEAKTVWCLLDAATMRPKRIETALEELLRSGNEGAS